MTRADLLALAERAERAEGPDQELDADIAAALGWPDVQFTGKARAYTASLDAALTLVPEGHDWHVANTSYYEGKCEAELSGPGKHSVTAHSDAATPALALVAAALRARAEEAGDD